MLLIVGWLFVALGIAGLFLPVLQGILFLLVGLVILSSVSPRAQRLLHRLEARFPALERHHVQARVWLDEKKSRFKRKR